MILASNEINKQKVGFFRFKKIGDKFLLTNETGDYSFLAPSQFDLFLTGKINKAFPDKFLELQQRNFIKNRMDLSEVSNKYALKNYVGQGPDLHIIVVTLKCDHKCLYCQAITEGAGNDQYDMPISIARQVVDKIFLTPNDRVSIEFQGGEPLLNFDTVKFITSYAIKKNGQANKKLSFSLVSNLTFMTKEKLEFIFKNRIQMCTSLDGPEQLHNKCRVPAKNKNSFRNAVLWFKRLQKEADKNTGTPKPAALTTITRFSLAYPKEIVDTYVKLGLKSIHLRPLSPFGILSKKRKSLHYTANEFLKFYGEALDHIISLNLNGKNISERSATIFLKKILSDINPGYLDTRSPCGAGIGQLAYNYNGDIYTCDEGRMLSRLGDESFKVANVSDFSHDTLSNSQVVKATCTASCLDSLPVCSECVFKPYCGVCPVYNHKVNGDLFKKSDFVCQINSGILDYLFKKITDIKIKDIFLKWLK